MQSPPPEPRHDWTVEEARAIHDLPLPDLIFRAQTLHRKFNDPNEVQLCALLSIKTGRCGEDCAYCSQSARHKTSVEKEAILDVEEVLEAARAARDRGANRFCMGASGRAARDGPEFDRVLEMVRGVRALGMEACCTLGMLTDEQAERLAEAGLTTYNHNLDTGPGFYSQIVSTHSYEDRLQTLERVRRAGISICSGGILGMGESVDDRAKMLTILANFEPPPENVPINALVPVEGTPLEGRPRVSTIEVARTVATARIMLPRARVRLSAGRREMTPEGQALCFVAGANSIFSGDKLLTTPNANQSDDGALLENLGMHPLGRAKRKTDPAVTTDAPAR